MSTLIFASSLTFVHAVLVLALCTAMAGKPPATAPEPAKPPAMSVQEMRQRIAELEFEESEALCRYNLKECLRTSTWGHEDRTLTVSIATLGSLSAATFAGSVGTGLAMVWEPDFGAGLLLTDLLLNVAWSSLLVATIASAVLRAQHRRVPKGQRLKWSY